MSDVRIRSSGDLFPQASFSVARSFNDLLAEEKIKNNVEKLKFGDIYQVAELVRNLSRREQEKHLSAGEKRLLVNSRRVLVSELRLAMDVSEEDAESALDEILTKSV